MAVHLKILPDGTITITSSPQGEVDITGLTHHLEVVEGLLNEMSVKTDAIVADLEQIQTFLENQKTALDALKEVNAALQTQVDTLTSDVAADEAKIAEDAQALADAQAKFDAAQAQVDADEQTALDKADAVAAEAV